MPFDNTLPRVAKLAGYVAAIAGAVVTLGTVWTMFDLPVIATRGYVDAEHAKDLAARNDIVSTVIELTLDQRDRLRRTRDGIQVRMTAATDPQSREDLQRLVEQANQDIADVANRAMTLEQLRGK